MWCAGIDLCLGLEIKIEPGYCSLCNHQFGIQGNLFFSPSRPFCAPPRDIMTKKLHQFSSDYFTKSNFAMNRLLTPFVKVLLSTSGCWHVLGSTWRESKMVFVGLIKKIHHADISLLYPLSLLQFKQRNKMLINIKNENLQPPNYY